MNSQSRTYRRSLAALACGAMLLGAVAVMSGPCAAGDEVAWSTLISTEHNPGGEPGEAADLPLAIRADDSGDLYVLMQSLFPALEGEGIGGSFGRSFALAKIGGDGAELWRREYGEDSIHTYDLAAGFGPNDRGLEIDSLGRPRRAGADWLSYSPSTAQHMVATRNTWDPATGDHVWVDQWHPASSSISNAFDFGFILDDADNMIAFGFSQFNGCCTSNYWPYATMLDASGNEVWFHSFEESSERGNYRSAAITSDGHIIVFGTASGGNIRLTKYDAATGAIIWTITPEVSGQTASFNGRMVLDGEDNIIVTGPGYGSGDDRFARILKFDSGGTLLWESTYSTEVEHPDGNTQYFSAHPHVLADHSFMLAGHFYFGDTGWDIVVRRYAADGTVVWHEQYDRTAGGGADADEFSQVLIADPDGGVVITGVVRDEDDPGVASIALVLRYSEEGELLWEHEEVDSAGGNMRARGVAFAPNGDLVVGYQVEEVDSDAADVLLVRYGSGLSVPGDIDGDGSVGVTDLLILLSAWGPCPDPCPPTCAADLDGDCSVGVADLLLVLVNWG